MTRHPLPAINPCILADMGRRRWQRANIEKRDRDRGKSLARPYWQMRYYVDVYVGAEVKRIRKTHFLGYVPGSTKPDPAKDELTKREAQRKGDAFIAAVNGMSGPVVGPMTLADFVAHHWRPGHLNIKVASSTRRKYESHLKTYILPALGSLRLDLITAEHLDKLLSAMTERSYMTKQDTRTVLSSIFTKAIQWRKIEGPSPVKDIDIGPKGLAREKRIFAPAEVALLLSALPEPSRTIALLLDATGCRISEALALQGKHVDHPREGYVMIAQSSVRGELREATKSEAGKRAVPMGKAADALRTRVGGPDDFLFTRDVDGGLCSDRDLNQHQLRPTLKACKLYVKGMGWHTFRRTTISELQAAGATQAEVQRFVGHGSEAMTKEYTVLSVERSKELSDRRRKETVQ